jgi:hypothetical protein
LWGQGPNYRKRSGERREQGVRRMVLVSFGEGDGNEKKITAKERQSYTS